MYDQITSVSAGVAPVEIGILMKGASYQPTVAIFTVFLRPPWAFPNEPLSLVFPIRGLPRDLLLNSATRVSMLLSVFRIQSHVRRCKFNEKSRRLRIDWSKQFEGWLACQHFNFQQLGTQPSYALRSLNRRRKRHHEKPVRTGESPVIANEHG